MFNQARIEKKTSAMNEQRQVTIKTWTQRKMYEYGYIICYYYNYKSQLLGWTELLHKIFPCLAIRCIFSWW